jgi:CRISPR/Cas system type I-B associated protein Csh2 (Cas7 group RAMP superfamily)
MKNDKMQQHLKDMYGNLFWLENEAVRLDSISTFDSEESQKLCIKEAKLRWEQFNTQRRLIESLLDAIL